MSRTVPVVFVVLVICAGILAVVRQTSPADFQALLKELEEWKTILDNFGVLIGGLPLYLAYRRHRNIVGAVAFIACAAASYFGGAVVAAPICVLVSWGIVTYFRLP